MEKTIGGMAIVWLLIVIAAAIGWVMNIITLIGIINDPITGIFIMRVVGIFVPPLGAVLGYF